MYFAYFTEFIVCDVSTIHYSPPTIHHPLSTIHYPLSTIHYPQSTIHHPLSIIHYPPSTIHYPLSIIHNPLSAIHYPPSTFHNPLSAIHYSQSTIHYPLWLHYTNVFFPATRTDTAECLRLLPSLEGDWPLLMAGTLYNGRSQPTFQTNLNSSKRGATSSI